MPAPSGNAINLRATKNVQVNQLTRVFFITIRLLLKKPLTSAAKCAAKPLKNLIFKGMCKMGIFADRLKTKLIDSIRDVVGASLLFVRKPGKDMTRKRKLPMFTLTFPRISFSRTLSASCTQNVGELRRHFAN